MFWCCDNFFILVWLLKVRFIILIALSSTCSPDWWRRADRSVPGNTLKAETSILKALCLQKETSSSPSLITSQEVLSNSRNSTWQREEDSVVLRERCAGIDVRCLEKWQLLIWGLIKDG